MSEAKNSPEKAHRYICPGCGADLLFEPHDGSLTCPYCNRKEHIPQSSTEVVERSYQEYLTAPSNKMATMAADALEVKCEGCGATVTFTPASPGQVPQFTLRDLHSASYGRPAP